MNAVDAGRDLAQRHLANTMTEPVDRNRSLINFAEVTGIGDWSLRSALCRMAQPEPARVSRLLESVRRVEGVLAQIQQALEKNGASCQRDGWLTADGTPSDGYPDVRTSDIARLVVGGHDLDAALDGYESDGAVPAITTEERMAMPVLVVAARLEELARTLTEWANSGPEHPPVDIYDQTCDEVEATLDHHGVPRETGPPPRGSRSRG